MWKGSLKGFPWICTNFYFKFLPASSFSPMASKNTWLPSIQMEFQVRRCTYVLRIPVVENLCRAWLAILRNPIAVIGFWKLVFATTIGYAAECSQSPTKGQGEHWEGKMGVWLDQEESGWVAQGDTSFLSIASASRMVVDHKHVWRDMYLWLFIKQFSVRTALGLLL